MGIPVIMCKAWREMQMTSLTASWGEKGSWPPAAGEDGGGFCEAPAVEDGQRQHLEEVVQVGGQGPPTADHRAHDTQGSPDLPKHQHLPQPVHNQVCINTEDKGDHLLTNNGPSICWCSQDAK